MFIDEHISQLFNAAMEQRGYLKLPDADVSTCKRSWICLAERSGMRRFKVALARALEHHVMPTDNQISDYMPPAHGIDRRSQHDPDCAACGGTGWRKIPTKQRYRAAKVKRCKGVEG
jgi:hypothetical protein